MLHNNIYRYIFKLMATQRDRQLDYPEAARELDSLSKGVLREIKASEFGARVGETAERWATRLYRAAQRPEVFMRGFERRRTTLRGLEAKFNYNLRKANRENPKDARYLVEVVLGAGCFISGVLISQINEEKPAQPLTK